MLSRILRILTKIQKENQFSIYRTLGIISVTQHLGQPPDGCSPSSAHLGGASESSEEDESAGLEQRWPEHPERAVHWYYRREKPKSLIMRTNVQSQLSSRHANLPFSFFLSRFSSLYLHSSTYSSGNNETSAVYLLKSSSNRVYSSRYWTLNSP